MMIEHRLRFLAARAVRVLRPKPQFMPLNVSDVLGAQNGLALVESFNDFYYRSGVAGEMAWRGIPMLKNPCDLWTIIDLMQRLQPRIIIETGTHYGGSATYFADMAKTIGFECSVITIDINPKWSYDPVSKGIHSLIGFSTAPKVVARVKQIVREVSGPTRRHVMLILDSEHSEANVLDELHLYSPLVTKGSYAIVEDTNINGHPSSPGSGAGPYEAVQKFLSTTKEFVIDRECQRHLLTFNPDGWLRRIV